MDQALPVLFFPPSGKVRSSFLDIFGAFGASVILLLSRLFAGGKRKDQSCTKKKGQGLFPKTAGPYSFYFLFS